MPRLSSDPVKRAAQREHAREYNRRYAARPEVKARQRVAAAAWRARRRGEASLEVAGDVPYSDPPRGFTCDRAVWAPLHAAFWGCQA